MFQYRIYEHRQTPSETIFIGVFHRCENQLITVLLDTTKVYPICNENKYLISNKNLSTIINRLQPQDAPRLCNVAGNPYRCTYTRLNQFLISSTIISACTISLAILAMYAHLLINQFKYKTHFSIAMLTIVLLTIGFIFILLTLILFGSTMSNDLYEYRYNLKYRLSQQSKGLALGRDKTKKTTKKSFSERQNQTNALEQTIRQSAASDYDIRLDWSSGLEIIALVLSSFTLVTQILYLFSTYRNRIG